jgi:hypothetical protein
MVEAMTEIWVSWLPAVHAAILRRPILIFAVATY